MLLLAAALAFAARPAAAPAQRLPAPDGLKVPAGFAVVTDAEVPEARELAPLPNGDLIAGTRGFDVVLVRDAEDAMPAAPVVLAHLPEGPASGVAYSSLRRELYIATETTVYAAPYRAGQGQLDRPPTAIARVRTGPIAPSSDGDVHTTTSLAFDDPTNTLYVAVGSSCNACTEADPTRASIFSMRPDGSGARKIATRIRNAVALAVDPRTHALWAGGAGQDGLPFGHPYEFLDDVSAHRAPADYGWPVCEENHRAYAPGASCAATVAPLIELPAYSTIIGAAFYPPQQQGRYAFPPQYRGGLFAAAHGSWHRTTGGAYAALPQVAFVAMRGDRPVTPVNWDDPNRQWRTFLGGFQSEQQRIGRPTGIAVGSKGSLFVADDTAGVIYRIRPAR